MSKFFMLKKTPTRVIKRKPRKVGSGITVFKKVPTKRVIKKKLDEENVHGGGYN